VYQEQFEDVLKEELFGYTFEAPHSSFGNSKLLQSHINHICSFLNENGWNHKTFVKGATSKSATTLGKRHWPSSELETAYCKPICSLFNNTIDGFSSDPVAKTASCHASQKLCFSPYDQPMEMIQ
jgi:hypothetical protein